MDKEQKEQFQQRLEQLGIYYSLQELDFIIAMCRAKAEYTHPYSTELPYGPVTCKIHFSGKLHPAVTGYEWTQYKIPDYKKGAYGGIEVLDVEARMKACSWRLQQQILKELPQIFDYLMRMSYSGDQGKLAAEALQLKYFLDTPVEQYVDLSKIKQKCRHMFYSVIEGKHSDLRIGEVALLIEGHPIFKPFSPDEPDLQQGEWIGLDGALNFEGTIHVRKCYPAFDLMSQLRQLPLSDPEDLERLASSLCHGIRWPVKLIIKGNCQTFMVSVDPEQRTAALENEQNVSIPLQSLLSEVKKGKKGAGKSPKSPALKRKRGKGL